MHEKNALKWVNAARARGRRMRAWYYLKRSPCALKQSELRAHFLVRFLEIMRKSDECMKNGKRKTFLSIPRNATAKKKTSRKPGNFFEFEMKRKIKWQADWCPIQSIVALLHRIDGILSVVMGYFSQTFIFT